MIENITLQSAHALADYHSQKCGISSEFTETVRKIYEAVCSSPLAHAVYAKNAEGKVIGLCLVTTDRQRLLSELHSRMPWTALKCLVQNGLKAKELLRLFDSPIKVKTSAAEIICMFHDENDVSELNSMVQICIDYLKTQGINEVYAHTYSAAAEQCMLNTEFECISRTGENDLILAADDRKALAKCFVKRIEGDRNFIPGPFTFQDRLRCAFRWELMVVLPIYTLVLIPFASSLAYLAHIYIDQRLNLPPIVSYPDNFLYFIFYLILGGLLLVYSYSYLILEGEGGPVPPWSSKTKRLVTTGPYTYVRHPSVIAKLIGVIGLAFAFNSWAFLLIVIPLLLCWSIGWNGLRQDADLVHVFGDEYLNYKNSVPMLIPKFFNRKK